MCRFVFGMLLLVSTIAYGADQDSVDLGALATADQVPQTAETGSDWHIFLESAFGGTAQRYGLPKYRNERLSVDVALDKNLSPEWRFIFADRLDWDWQGESPREVKFNTLKELYLSHQISASEIIDFGRINTRYGVGSGYNPTDYFRDGAIRNVISVNPDSLRDNRLGSVMLRTQTLWSGGGLTAILSPKLADRPSDDAFSVDAGATNRRNRWLLAVSQRMTENLNPQFLLYGEQDKQPQLGFDLTSVLGDAAVAYIEWSGGQGASQYPDALGSPARSVFRNRLSTGLTYSAANNMSLTLKAEYNAAALDRSGWTALGSGPLPVYEQYRGYVQQAQDLPTRKAVFVYGSWQDAMINHLDLRGFARQDLIDQSRLSWMEARYHWAQTDIALQWQRYSGRAWSDYGGIPQRTSWQAVVTYFF